jgi:hypothetical protein
MDTHRLIGDSWGKAPLKEVVNFVFMERPQANTDESIDAAES